MGTEAFPAWICRFKKCTEYKIVSCSIESAKRSISLRQAIAREIETLCSRHGKSLSWQTFDALMVLGCCLILGALCRQLQLSDLGCFIDSGSARDLAGLKYLGFNRIGDKSVTQYSNLNDYGNVMSTVHMSQELCASICALGGFRYMGLQAWDWCTCDNSYGLHGAAPISECNRACSGNSSQNCGGAYRNRVFRMGYLNENIFVRGNPNFAAMNNSTAVDFSTVGATSRIHCVAQCRTDCQAVIFNMQQRLCHLLEFAVLPAGLSGASSVEFFVRV